MKHRGIKLKVACTVIVEIDWSKKNWDAFFTIEENGCPGTGSIGAVIDKAYYRGEANSTCWACGLQGENKIIEYDGKVVTDDIRTIERARAEKAAEAWRPSPVQYGESIVETQLKLNKRKKPARKGKR